MTTEDEQATDSPVFRAEAASPERAEWGVAQRELNAAIQAASPESLTATLTAFAHAVAKLSPEQVREITAIVNDKFNRPAGGSVGAGEDGTVTP